jgi:hypothetical protein
MAAIDDVFPDDVIARFRAVLPDATPFLQHRYDVLTASGPFPSDSVKALRLRKLRAERASWEAYIEAAAATNVLDDDVVARFRADVDANVRSAHAECLAAWLFTSTLRQRITPRPLGRGERRLEFRVEHPPSPFNVEVKAPHEPPAPMDVVWSGNGAPKLEECLVAATKQFHDDHANVLVIVPELRVSVTSDRYQFVQAFLGEFVIMVPINMRTGGPAGETENRFTPRGRFARRRGKTDKPANTRVGAVVVIEERFVDPAVHALKIDSSLFPFEYLAQTWRAQHDSRALMWIEPSVFVIHNPFAARSIDRAVFEPFPQFVITDERDGEFRMGWTDGHPVIP